MLSSQEIDELLRGTELLQQEVDELRRRVAKQQEDYSSLQKQHVRDLEEMRSAGHQALAVVVEEYKVINYSTIMRSINMGLILCGFFLVGVE